MFANKRKKAFKRGQNSDFIPNRQKEISSKKFRKYRHLKFFI